MARFDSKYFAQAELKEQAARKKTKKQVQQEEEVDALYSLELDRIRQEEKTASAPKAKPVAAEEDGTNRHMTKHGFPTLTPTQAAQVDGGGHSVK